MPEKPLAAKTGNLLINACIAYRTHRSKPVHTGVRSMLIRGKRPISKPPAITPAGISGNNQVRKSTFPQQGCNYSFPSESTADSGMIRTRQHETDEAARGGIS